MSRRSSPIKRKSLAEERPDLLAQWSKTNLLSPSDVSCGSHIKVRWVCEKGHEWDAIVKNRVLLGSGCPYCNHRAVLKGYNDLQTEYPEIARSWSDKNPDNPYDYSPSSNKVIIWQPSMTILSFGRALKLVYEKPRLLHM